MRLKKIMTTNSKKNIILIGLMGAGKTTISLELAKKLKDFEAVDLDEQIEAASGMKISEIFEKFGEEHFRKLETQAAKEISQKSGKIISTGGGIVCKRENLEILRKNGIVFYLSAPPSVLFERIKHTNHRPLLQKENPQKILEDLLKNRENAYKTADFEIKTENKTLDEVTEKIIENYGTKI